MCNVFFFKECVIHLSSFGTVQKIELGLSGLGLSVQPSETNWIESDWMAWSLSPKLFFLKNFICTSHISDLKQDNKHNILWIDSLLLIMLGHKRIALDYEQTMSWSSVVQPQIWARRNDEFRDTGHLHIAQMTKSVWITYIDYVKERN